MAAKTEERDNLHGDPESGEPSLRRENDTGGYNDDYKNLIHHQNPSADQADGNNSASDSGPSSDTPQKQLGKSELSESEAQAGSGASTAIGAREQAMADQAGLFRKEKGSSFGRFKKFLVTRTRKQIATVGIITVIGGGALTGISVMQGPLQVMHLSQILQKPLTSQGNDSEVRINGLLRYAKTGEIGHTRVSYFGSRSVERTSAKLADIGFTIAEKTAAGRPISAKLDLSKFDPGTTTENAATKFVEANNIPPENAFVDAKNNILYIRNTEGGAIPDSVFRNAQKGAILKSMEGKSLGKTITAVKARPVLRFNGTFSWLHPWKKAQVRLIDSAAEADKARQAKKGERSARAKSRIAEMKEKIDPKAFGAVAIASGVQLGVCVAKDMAHQTPLLSYENLRRPARIDTLDQIAQGDQLRSLDDFSVIQPGASARSFTDSDGKNIWEAKALNALAYKNAGTGVDLGDDLKSGFSSKSPEADFESALGSIGGDALCSTAGQIAGGALGIAALVLAAPATAGAAAAYAATAVASSAATIAGVTAATTLIPKMLADKPLTEDLAGPLKGNIDAYASVDLANDFYRKAGGAELGAATSASIDDAIEQKEKQQFASKNFLARTFDVRDYRSITSRTIDSTNLDPAQSMSNVASGALNMWGLTSKLTGTFTPKTSAAEGAYDFGFPKYGFSQEDLNNPIMEDPYDNAEKAADILASNPTYVSRAEKCFGVRLHPGAQGWQVDLVDNQEGDPEKEVLPNTRDYIDANCAEGSNDWLRIRLFIFDSRTMEAYACYDGDDEACIATGVTTAAQSQEAAEEEAADTSKISVNIATWNVLGASHTDPGGNAAARFAGYSPRIERAVKVIRQGDYDVVGLQEFQGKQREKLLDLAGGDYDIFPKTASYSDIYSENSIIWKKSRFDLSSSGRTRISYFEGSTAYAPWIELEDKESKQKFFVMNTHDPVTNDAHPGSAQYREENAAILREIAESKMESGEPVLLTGDFNSAFRTRLDKGDSSDRSRLTYCIITSTGKLKNAYDIANDKDGNCPTAAGIEGISSLIDHIYVSSGVNVDTWQQVANEDTYYASDHEPVASKVELSKSEATE